MTVPITPRSHRLQASSRRWRSNRYIAACMVVLYLLGATFHHFQFFKQSVQIPLRKESHGHQGYHPSDVAVLPERFQSHHRSMDGLSLLSTTPVQSITATNKQSYIEFTHGRFPENSITVLNTEDSVHSSFKEITTSDMAIISIQDAIEKSSVDYFACCGLGHRLNKMSEANFVAKSRNWALRVYWGTYHE